MSSRIPSMHPVPTVSGGKNFWLKDNLACIVTYANRKRDKLPHIKMETALKWVKERAKKDNISIYDASEIVKRELRGDK